MIKQENEKLNTTPFVKWVGGKRQLLPEIENRLPKNYNNYFEPFLGGGAVLFDLQPNKATVGDVNEILISTYNAIKNNEEELIKYLDKYANEYNASQEKKNYYLSNREKYNSKIESNLVDIETCALFIFLNKTCFNGLYRVNAKGLFNVPFNNKENLVLYDKENLNNISNFLKNVKILNCDFEETCKKAKKNDFVFFDSPYAPIKDDSFESYTKEGFSLENHQRLAKLFRKLSDKGVYCMLTNHNTQLINNLYNGFNIDVVKVRRAINSDGANRKGEEVIITNYQI